MVTSGHGEHAALIRTDQRGGFEVSPDAHNAVGVRCVRMGEVPRRRWQRARSCHGVADLTPVLLEHRVIVVKDTSPLVISDELRGAVTRMAERLGAVRVIAAGQWLHIADQCNLGEVEGSFAVDVVIGTPAVVLKHGLTTDEDFGFVMPVSQRSRSWQRSGTWYDDTTLDLWHAGWSPLAIDRILVPTGDLLVEFVIGNVCRLPAVEVVLEDC